MPKFVKIDWLSISLPYSSIVSRDFDTDRLSIRPQIRDLYPSITDWIMSYPDMIEGGGNRIFNRSLRSKLGGFHIFWNSNKNFSLIEIEGTGVQNLREQKLLKSILRQYSHLLTRIDIAEDFETICTPREFAEKRDGKRFTSHAEINSETGETCYVGSRSSDRFARIYRFASPHPRSHLLRCEFQLRDENAKSFAELLQSHKLSELVLRLYKTFGIYHPLAITSAPQGKLLSAPRASKMGATERWLFSQVLPACKKLIDDGNTEIIDIFGKQLYHYFNDRLISKEVHDGTQSLLSDPEFISR